MDGRTKTRGHKVCYNPMEMSRKGSGRESMAIERPTNAIECIADGQKIDLLGEVSDKEKDMPDVPDGPHKLRDESLELQNLPIVGESQDSKWQAAEASAKAEGTSRSAEATRKARIVDGKALPGSEPAKRASAVDKAEEMPDERQPQAKQVELYHKRSQHNENANRNIPSAHGVPLEGEWSVCASSRVRDSKSDSRGRGVGERASVDKWSWPVEKLRLTVRIPKGCCQLGRADGNASCKEALVDGQDESEKLVPTTVKLDNPGSGKTPRMCLGGTKTQVGEHKGHGCRADESNGQANRSRGQAAASTVLNTCRTSSMGDSDGTGARLDARGARRNGAGPDGHANRSDVSSGYVDVPGIQNGTNTTADATEIISTRQNALQTQSLPIRARRRDEVEPRSCADVPNMCIDMHDVAMHTNMAGDTQKRVSTGPADPKPQDLPIRRTKPCQDEADGLESCPGTQTARIHVQDVGNKLNKPENTSVTRDLPVNGAKLCIGVPNKLESPTDASDACTRMQSVADDSRRPIGNLERVRKSQNGCKRSNLPVKSLKTRPEEPRKPSDRADALSGRTGMQSDRNGARTTAKTRKTISKTPNKPKMPNSPVGAKIQRIGKADGWGNHADGSGVCRDTQCIETDTKPAKNASRNVKTHQRRSRRPNSPCRIEIETAKRPERWKHISDNGNDGYAPQNTPIESLDMRIRKIVFGQSLEVLGMDEDVEANIEVEKDGDMGDECDGDMDGTISGGDVDSNQVEAAQLTAERQQTCKNARTRRNDLPVSPGRSAHP